MGIAIFQLIIYLTITLLLVIPLGWYIAKVLEGKPLVIERVIARWTGIDLNEQMDWKQYLITMLWVNMFGMLTVYAVQRLQYYLPLNPQHFEGVAPALAFNTAVSFTTNTDWQAYSGESTMSYFTQTFALITQQFISVATGLALMAAFIRGLVRSETNKLGNYWQDVIRGILYIFMPLSILFALVLVSQGVIQNFKVYESIVSLDNPQVTQQIPMGPVASMVAIKQIGTNGGGFFATGSAHPFENPSNVTNYLEMLAIILIPAALCYTFGILVNDRRQGWVLLIAMLIIFIPLSLIAMHAEQIGNPLLSSLQIENIGNMEGKEQRIGPLYSALWGAASTATSNGSVNYMFDSAMPISGFVYMVLMDMGGVIFGGVGCGIYGTLLIVIITVFVAGLMVGRTPEYLGKKIEPYEMKLVSFIALILSLMVVFCTAIACSTTAGVSSIHNPGAHGFSEILYAFTSMRNNNGSAFAGLNANTDFYNILGGIVILVGRYWLIIGLLAVANSLAIKKRIPSGIGTLPTHDSTFLLFLIGVIIVVGTLSFLPALALGPLVEHLTLWATL